MRSTLFLPLMLSALLTACASHGPISTPPPADIMAAVESKPLPTEAIVTDPAASARYNASVEAWGDRLRSAGLRLCRYFKATGMRVDCP